MVVSRTRFGSLSWAADSITAATTIPVDADWVGFCFPVYAFALPRIVRRYVHALSARVDGDCTGCGLCETKERNRYVEPSFLKKLMGELKRRPQS